MKCFKCDQLIPAARIKAVPGTKTCIECSTAPRVAGFPIISGKNTYSELQIISQESAADAKQDRKGGISEGVKFKNMPPPKLSNLE